MNQEELSRIENILKAQEEIVDIEHDKWDVPEMDYSAFSKGFRPKAAEYLNDLINFLHLPYITDTFANHYDRREWRRNLKERLASKNGEDLAQEVFDFYEKNSLRGTTHLNYISVFVYMLAENYIGENPEFSKIAKRIIKSVEDVGISRGDNEAAYHQMETGAKIHYIKGLKQDLYSLIKVVSHHRSPKK